MKPETKKKIMEKLVKINGFLDDTLFIWIPAMLIAYWIIIPASHLPILIFMLAVTVFILVFFPLVLLMAGFVPLIWIADKLQRRKT